MICRVLRVINKVTTTNYLNQSIMKVTLQFDYINNMNGYNCIISDKYPKEVAYNVDITKI